MGETVAILGAGAMGEAVLAGLLRAGRPAAEVLVAERRPERAAEIAERYRVRVVDNAQAAAECDVAVLLVKPADVGALLAEIAGALRPTAVVVSMAAGVTTEFISRRLAGPVPVVRVMPNTPALVSAGMSVLSPGAHCEPAQLERVGELLTAIGRVAVVPEALQDAATAVSGSGPAYLFYLAEAMADGAVAAGLPRAAARELVGQTLFGAATMLQQTGEHPTVLREQVTSPGGTTAAAVGRLEAHGVRAAIAEAIAAARDRSRELGG